MTRSREEADRMVETVRRHMSGEPDPIQAKIERERVACSERYGGVEMIQRWDIDSETIGNKNALIPSAEGDWVEYSEHIGIVNELIEALEKIAKWEFDIMGDCVADATRVAEDAIKKARG